MGFIAFSLGQDRKAPDDLLKVGAILPLTGDIAFVGEEIKKGIDLAVQEINENGERIEVIYEDDAFDLKQSVSAANKLINIDEVDVVVTMLIEEAQPIMPLFATEKTPLLVLWDSNHLINTGGEYIFSNGFSTEQAARDMAKYASETLNLRKVAIVGHVDPWAEISTGVFTETFKSLGGEVTFNETLSVETTDYRTAITKAKQSDTDGVYFPLIPPHNAQFLTQAGQMGLGATLMTGDPLIQDVINEAGSAAEGVFFTNFYTDKAEELMSKYKSVYGTDILDAALVSFGYDGIVKLMDAKNLDSSLKSGLDKVFGPSRTADRAEKIYQVKQGTPQLVH